MKTLDKKNAKKIVLPDDLRRYSVIPKHALECDLSLVDWRVLTTLCFYTNYSGVCWPTHETIEKCAGIGRNGIMASIKRLESFGLVRLLKPEWYDGQVSKWLTNRYQILYEGKQTPLATGEQIREAEPFNWSQEPKEQEAIKIGESKDNPTHKDRDLKGRQLFNSFNKAINQFGSNAIYSSNQSIAHRLAENGLTPDQVSTDTIAYINANLARTGTIPTSLNAIYPMQNI